MSQNSSFPQRSHSTKSVLQGKTNGRPYVRRDLLLSPYVKASIPPGGLLARVRDVGYVVPANEVAEFWEKSYYYDEIMYSASSIDGDDKDESGRAMHLREDIVHNHIVDEVSEEDEVVGKLEEIAE
ncbi:hypothetical protein CJJ07_000464 [Candidozyma auris]|nr:hypothetical protein CJJ07_000464 [[Candida] auris]QEL62145.1 hypothetical protein CJJ09_004313 [[Candida] auris]